MFGGGVYTIPNKLYWKYVNNQSADIVPFGTVGGYYWAIRAQTNSYGIQTAYKTVTNPSSATFPDTPTDPSLIWEVGDSFNLLFSGLTAEPVPTVIVAPTPTPTLSATPTPTPTLSATSTPTLSG
jgi:hypothetical protein